MENRRVLAMYDVREKQEYIYRSGQIKEIAGASAIIRDVFKDYLFPAAIEVRNRIKGTEKENADSCAIYQYAGGGNKMSSPPETLGEDVEDFSVEAFESRMEGNQYIGETVYDGGGNFLVLYRDKETCIQVNRIFTRELMKGTDTLKVLCTILENPDFGRYREDSQKLYERHRKNEATESVIYPVNSLPVTQVDPFTSRPLSVKRLSVKAGKNGIEKMSRERAAKQDKYRQEEQASGRENGARRLEDMVGERGKESLLAVLHIDGNHIGAQREACLEGKESYEDCITQLRKFSAQIRKNYVDDRIKDIDAMLDQKYETRGRAEGRRRTIVAAGDEVTVICNARDALNVAKAYLQGLKEGSSCVGIAIFHSHAPYADAYRLAKGCCESGKRFMRERGLDKACLLDFHYCQGATGISLEAIRKRELQGISPSRPWLFDGFSRDRPEGFFYSVELAEEMAETLRKLGRSSVKGLLGAALNGPADLEMELERINAHRAEPEDFTLRGKLGNQQKRRLLYDMVLVYDLWFREEGRRRKWSMEG